MIKLVGTRVINYEKGIVKFELNIDACFLDGYKYLIMGSNGSGKSTLLAALEGRIAHKGLITYDGIEVREAKPDLFSFASIEIPQKIKVDNYLAFLGFAKEAIPEMLSLLCLDQYKNVNIAKLDSNQQNRLKIAYLIKNENKYIFIDEITRGLSFNQSEKIIKFLVSYFKNSTLILVDHHIEEIKEYFDEALFLKDGKIDKSNEQEKVTFQEINKYQTKSPSKSWTALHVLKHRLKCGWLMCVLAFVFLLVTCLSLFAINNLPYQTSIESRPMIGLRSSDNDIDISGAHFNEKGIFDGNIYQDLSVRISTGSSQTSDDINVKLSASFDNLGKRLISGNLPVESDEVAVSSNLVKYAIDDTLSVYISMKDSGLYYKLKITGRIRGKNIICLSNKFYSMRAIDINDIVVSSKDDIIDFNYGARLQTTVYAPNEETLNQYLDFDDISIHNPSLQKEIHLGKDINYEIKFFSEYKEVSINFSFDDMIRIIEKLESDVQTSLFYDNYDDLISDRQMFIDRGYTVYSKFDAKSLTSTIFAQVIGNLVYCSFVVAMFFFFNNLMRKKEKIVASKKYQVIDRLIYATLVLLSFLVNIILTFVYAPTFISLLLTYISFLIVSVLIGVPINLRGYRHDKIM